MMLIHKDALIETIRNNHYLLATRNGSVDKGMFTIGILQAIDEQPAIDAVEVVRCKDCDMSDFYKAGNGKTYCRCLESEKSSLEATDFCSYGHKKDVM